MQFHQLKLNKNNWVLSFFVRSVLISYPISPLRRRENKTRTFWSPEPILSRPREETAIFLFVETDVLKCLENICCFIQTFQTFVCSKTSKVIEIQVRPVNWEDGLQKQFWMLRDFRENWQFRLSQFCMARDSILILTSKLQMLEISQTVWKSIRSSKSYFFGE